jgi:hypothetical protein
VYIKFCANFRKSVVKTPEVISQTFREESMSRTQVFEWHARCKAKSKQRRKKLTWQAKHSVLHTTVMFYSNCMKICEDFTLNFGDKTAGCCTMKTHNFTFPFSPGNFLPKSTCHPPPMFW